MDEKEAYETIFKISRTNRRKYAAGIAGGLGIGALTVLLGPVAFLVGIAVGFGEGYIAGQEDLDSQEKYRTAMSIINASETEKAIIPEVAEES
jgi:hypothetical protein